MWRHVQIFMVATKKLIDWDQIEFSLLSRVAFEARRKQHTNQSLVKIGSTNPHKKLHVPPHAYRAAAAKFLRRKTKNLSKRLKLNFHFSLACFFDKKSSTTQKSVFLKMGSANRIEGLRLAFLGLKRKLIAIKKF